MDELVELARMKARDKEECKTSDYSSTREIGTPG